MNVHEATLVKVVKLVREATRERDYDRRSDRFALYWKVADWLAGEVLLEGQESFGEELQVLANKLKKWPDYWDSGNE